MSSSHTGIEADLIARDETPAPATAPLGGPCFDNQQSGYKVGERYCPR